MAKHRTILLIVCFLTSSILAQTKPQIPPRMPPNMQTQANGQQMIEQRRAAEEEKDREEFRRMTRIWWRQVLDDIKQKLRASDSQWKLIEPRLEKVLALREEAVRPSYSYKPDKIKGSIHWRKYKPDEKLADLWFCRMTEGMKIVNELIDLWDDPKSTDAQIKQKMDALQKIRDKAREDLREARRELREVLNGPRQEAVLQIMQILD